MTTESEGTTLSDSTIERVTEDLGPHCEPSGWHHRTEHPFMVARAGGGCGTADPGPPAVTSSSAT